LVDRKEINKVLDKINKEFHKGTKEEKPIAFIAADRPDLVTAEYYPTGITVLDEALGGGVPLGSVTTIHGTPFSGKTSLALTVAARLTKEQKYVIYLNLEGIKLDTFKLFGIDMNYMVEISAMDFAEQNIDAVTQLMYDKETRTPKNLVSAIIIDSLNNLYTKVQVDNIEEDGFASNGQMARRAKLIDDFLTMIYGRGVLRDGLMILAITQDRANISGAGKGAPTIMSCGESLKFNSKVTIKLSRKPQKARVNGIERVIGHTVTFDISKNSIFGNVGKGEYSVIYGQGIDDSVALFDKALSEDWGYIIKPDRSTYRFILPIGDINVKGKDAAINIIKAHPEVAQELRRLLMGAKPKPLPVSVGFDYVFKDEEVDEPEE
jgi:RecA/RadA recombinase